MHLSPRVNRIKNPQQSFLVENFLKFVKIKTSGITLFHLVPCCGMMLNALVRGYRNITLNIQLHALPCVTQRKLPRREHVERRFPIDESFMPGSGNAAHLKSSCSIRPPS